MPATSLHRDTCTQVVRLLKQERERRGLSKYALAIQAGVSQQMIGYLERGLRTPSFETVLRLADALELELGKLVRDGREAAAALSTDQPA